MKGAETAKYYTYYKNIDDTNIKAVEVVLNLVDTDETSISVNVHVNDPKYLNLVPTPQEYSLFCAKLEELIKFKGSYTELDFAIEALDFHKYHSERGLVEYRRTSNITNRVDIIILKVKTERDFAVIFMHTAGTVMNLHLLLQLQEIYLIYSIKSERK